MLYHGMLGEAGGDLAYENVYFDAWKEAHLLCSLSRWKTQLNPGDSVLGSRQFAGSDEENKIQ